MNRVVALLEAQGFLVRGNPAPSPLRTIQMVGRGIRGPGMWAPAALRDHSRITMDDGTGNLVALGHQQFNAAAHFASTDQEI